MSEDDWSENSLIPTPHLRYNGGGSSGRVTSLMQFVCSGFFLEFAAQILLVPNNTSDGSFRVAKGITSFFFNSSPDERHVLLQGVTSLPFRKLGRIFFMWNSSFLRKPNLQSKKMEEQDTCPSPCSALESLPVEILYHILAYLGSSEVQFDSSGSIRSSPNGLASCLTLSKHFNAIVSDSSLWKTCCNRYSVGWIIREGSERKDPDDWRGAYYSLYPPPYFYERSMWLQDVSAIVSLVVLGTATADNAIKVSEVLLGAQRLQFVGQVPKDNIALCVENGQYFESGDSGVFLLIYTIDGACLSLNPPSLTYGERPLLSLREWESQGLRKKFLQWRKERRGKGKYVNPLIHTLALYSDNKAKRTTVVKKSNAHGWFTSMYPKTGRYKSYKADSAATESEVLARDWENSDDDLDFEPDRIYVWDSLFGTMRRNEQGLFIRNKTSTPSLTIWLVDHGRIESAWRFSNGRLLETFRHHGAQPNDWFGSFASEKDSQSSELLMTRADFNRCLAAYLLTPRTVSGLRISYQYGLLRRYAVIEDQKVVQKMTYNIDKGGSIAGCPKIVGLKSCFICPDRRKEGQRENFRTRRKPQPPPKSDIFNDLVAALNRRRQTAQRASSIFGDDVDDGIPVNSRVDGWSDSEESEEEEKVYPQSKPLRSIFDEELEHGLFDQQPTRPKPTASRLFDSDEDEDIFSLPRPTRRPTDALFSDDSFALAAVSNTATTTSSTNTTTKKPERGLFDPLDDEDDPFGF